MVKALGRARQRFRGFIIEKSISQAQLATVCRIVFWGSLIPLILIALYNYPADDDFGFTLPAATAWVNTHSIGAVLQAIWDKTYDTYMTWQGNFVSTFFFSVNPMIWNIKLYFLSTWYILGLLCLSVGYLLKGVMHHYLSASRTAFAIVYAAVMVLVLQFMPHIGDGVYWYNGGQYTVSACVLMISLGLLLRCGEKQSRRRSIFRGIMVALCGFALGGSFYGPALGALVILGIMTVLGFVRKTRNRWHCAVAIACFSISFAISVTAPGIALRQERTGEATGALFSVITAILDSFDLTGKWLSPQLFAMLLLIVPVMWKPLRESSHSFAYPFWIFVMLYGLFAASIAPGIYTTFGYGTSRYLNVVYFYFLMMVIGSLLYAEGALIRFLERKNAGESAEHTLAACEALGEHFRVWYLLICVAMLVFGGFAYTIMNTSSVSASKSLLTGEAARFSQEMAERQEYIRVTDSDVVAVKALSGQPYVFKYDRLPFQGIYGRVRYMKWYFELFYNAAQMK